MNEYEGNGGAKWSANGTFGRRAVARLELPRLDRDAVENAHYRAHNETIMITTTRRAFRDSFPRRVPHYRRHYVTTLAFARALSTSKYNVNAFQRLTAVETLRRVMYRTRVLLAPRFSLVIARKIITEIYVP